jgi:DDE superfamily endonuclease
MDGAQQGAYGGGLSLPSIYAWDSAARLARGRHHDTLPARAVTVRPGLPYEPLSVLVRMPRRSWHFPAKRARDHKHAFFGALDAVTGQWFWADHPRKRAVHFVAFLAQIVAAYPMGRLYIALDGAPAHTAKVVQRWAEAHPRVLLLRLPTPAHLCRP